MRGLRVHPARVLANRPLEAAGKCSTGRGPVLLKTNGCLGIQRIHFLIIYLSQGKLAGEMFACSSNVIAFLWSLSVDLISQPYKVFLVVSSIFCGQESSGT